MLRALVAVLTLLAAPANAITWTASIGGQQWATQPYFMQWNYASTHSLPPPPSNLGTLTGIVREVTVDASLRLLSTTEKDFSSGFIEFLVASSPYSYGDVFQTGFSMSAPLVQTPGYGWASESQNFHYHEAAVVSGAPPPIFQLKALTLGYVDFPHYTEFTQASVTWSISYTFFYDEPPVVNVPLPASGILLLPLLAAGLLRRRR